MTEQNHLQQNRLLFLLSKRDDVSRDCFTLCTRNGKSGSSLSGKQLSCLENCEVKQTNAYNYMYDIIIKGGVHRQSDSYLKKRVIN